MQRQISNWSKEISILAEKETGLDNGKLNRSIKDDLKKKYKVENVRDIAQLTETLGQKVQTQAHTIKK